MFYVKFLFLKRKTYFAFLFSRHKNYHFMNVLFKRKITNNIFITCYGFCSIGSIKAYLLLTDNKTLRIIFSWRKNKPKSLWATSSKCWVHLLSLEFLPHFRVFRSFFLSFFCFPSYSFFFLCGKTSSLRVWKVSSSKTIFQHWS